MKIKTLQNIVSEHRSDTFLISNAISFAPKEHKIDLINFIISYGCRIRKQDIYQATEYGEIELTIYLLNKRDEREKPKSTATFFSKPTVNVTEQALLKALEKCKFDLAEVLLKRLESNNSLTDVTEQIRKIFSESTKRSKQWGISREDYLIQIFNKDDLINHDRWRKLTSDYSKYHDSASPYGFSLPVFETLLPLMKIASRFEKTQNPEFFAYHLAILFDDPNEAMAYLKQYESGHPDSLQPIHDACLFELPKQGMWTIPVWRDLVMKYGEKASNLLGLAPKIEEKMGVFENIKTQVETFVESVLFFS